MNRKNSIFLVNKYDLFETTFSEEKIPISKENEAILEIERYAFSSNNITYGVIGDTLGYWNFFPAEEPYGIIPVWGFANVISSKNEYILEGDRFYGYFPMSRYLKVIPKKGNDFGFVDDSNHRRKLPPVYNHYSKIIKYADESLEYHPLIKPLFLTSFLNYFFLQDEKFFDCDQIILTSASSKTALSLAFLLSKYKSKVKKKIIAITSEKNMQFVSEIKFYDTVLSYDNAEENLKRSKSVIVDFAGNSDYLKKLSDHLGDGLKHVSLIGLADWSSKTNFKSIPNSKFFFAPNHAEKRYREMGVKKTTLMADELLKEFIIKVKNYIKLEYCNDPKDIHELYLKSLKGKIDPSKGYMVKN
tara:strand:- start:1208 stop:2281 length:1074 start_codon:yes stop_codon:yes gene_type:complete